MTDPRGHPGDPSGSADPFLEYDAAYVLGALSPDERQAFQQHLRTCAACTARVNEITDLPGLLSRADPQTTDEPPPDLLLPRLLATARAERRRRRLLSGSGWFAAAACAVALVLVVAFGSSTPTAGSAAPTGSAGSTASPATPMLPVENIAMSAQVSLTGVSWGTKIELNCTYTDGTGGSGGSGGYIGDDAYLLVVVGPDGAAQRVGSWKVLPGRSYTLAASTDLASTDIDRVEVQTMDGHTVLQLSP